MSQKIIIPKGTIDSAHTTIIEIPTYLHDTSTVVVATPRKADSTIEQAWAKNGYIEESNAEQNDTIWEQAYNIQETNDNQVYPSNQPEQYMPEQYEEVDNGETQQQGYQDRPCINYVEEIPMQPTGKSHYDPYMQQMEKSMVDKRRELIKLKEERQRMLEEGRRNYENLTQRRNEEGYVSLSEVPENMRGQTLPRENSVGKDKKRKQHEFERYQPYVPQMCPVYQQVYPRSQVSSEYPGMQNQQNTSGIRVSNQQWNPGHPDVQYAQPDLHRKQTPGQVDFGWDDTQQYQRARRRPVLTMPRN